MPHQCTTCGRVFDDGSKEMLSGCPDCGGTKFQFQPEGVDPGQPPDTDAEPPERPGPDNGVARTVGKTAATVRDIVGGSGSQDRPSTEEPPADARPPDAGEPSDPATAETAASVAEDEDDDIAPTADRDAATTADRDTEDAAQASARGDVVTPDELPPRSEADSGEEHHFEPVASASAEEAEPPEQERPDLEELRKELNDQFESIKVLEPGQYELNLMELYDREEYIVALEEDGRYSIQVPEAVRESKST